MPLDPQRHGPSALRYIGLPAYSTTRTLLLQNLMKPLLEGAVDNQWHGYTMSSQLTRDARKSF